MQSVCVCVRACVCERVCISRCELAVVECVVNNQRARSIGVCVGGGGGGGPNERDVRLAATQCKEDLTQRRQRFVDGGCFHKPIARDTRLGHTL
jgi:hypothetical protein